MAVTEAENEKMSGRVNGESRKPLTLSLFDSFTLLPIAHRLPLLSNNRGGNLFRNC